MGSSFLSKHIAVRVPLLNLVRPIKKQKLPVVLSIEEVQQILGGLRRLRYRACIEIIYACGLRLQEGVSLEIAPIVSERTTGSITVWTRPVILSLLSPYLPSRWFWQKLGNGNLPLKWGFLKFESS